MNFSLLEILYYSSFGPLALSGLFAGLALVSERKWLRPAAGATLAAAVLMLSAILLLDTYHDWSYKTLAAVFIGSALAYAVRVALPKPAIGELAWWLMLASMLLTLIYVLNRWVDPALAPFHEPGWWRKTLLWAGPLVGVMAILGVLYARDRKAKKLLTLLKWLGVALGTAAFLDFVLPTLSIDRTPFRTVGETMILLAWTTVVINLITEKTQKITLAGPFAAFAALAFMSVNLVFPEADTRELQPALQSGWFAPHVILYFLAYGALVLSCVTAAAHLLALAFGSKQATRFAKMSYQFVTVGFPFLTFGLWFGAFWGQNAWGAYWAWDPKENWALVTWIVYLMYLHLRHIKGWGNRHASVFLLLGGVVIFITYLVVNYLPTASSSLHTY